MGVGKRKRIKLRLKGFDHRQLDGSMRQIVMTVLRTDAEMSGPIPLPVKTERFTVNRSPHIDKESREQFEIREHSRLLYIDPTPQTIDALMKLDLPAGVEVEIKIMD
jgi:small subunit ribosomal protein S10